MDQDNLLKPINSATVHKICSGQVIIDLTTAVKELVENSLDAGATHIEVKFKDYGLESVSVSDNGPGITTGNYATLCLKHYTSKLSAFDDLATVRTYGFRGEALSSLCALAHVTVTTATADLSPRGVQLDYASTGVLKGQTAIAREVGTTITLSQLFAQWPVRYTQFKKTIRREYARCMAVLEAYGAVCAGTRLVVSHQTAKQGTASQMVFQSNGKPLWLDRIAGVFGPKFRSLLTSYSVALDEHASDGAVDEAVNNADTAEEPFPAMEADGSNRQNQSRPDDQPPSPGSSRIDGYVSLPRSGCGRSGTERQFYYVNGRPCDLPKVARVVNEVYRSYNPQQYPIVFLNIHLDPGAFDVNVSPDKRTLFLHDEARLQNRIRDTLHELFEPSRSSYDVCASKPVPLRSDSVSTAEPGSPAGFFASQTLLPASLVGTPSLPPSPLSRGSTWLGSADDPSSRTPVVSRLLNHLDLDSSMTDGALVRKSESDDSSQSEENLNKRHCKDAGPLTLLEMVESHVSSLGSKGLVSLPKGMNVDHADIEIDMASLAPLPVFAPASKPTEEEASHPEASISEKPLGEGLSLPILIICAEEAPMTIPTASTPARDSLTYSSRLCRSVQTISLSQFTPVVYQRYNKRSSNIMNYSQFSAWSHVDQEPIAVTSTDPLAAELTNPLVDSESVDPIVPVPSANTKGDSEDAVAHDDQPARKTISKSDFGLIRVIGQFNLGFIIGCLHNDLYIIDQHASDEKFNFETLQATSVITSQPLIRPKCLDLSVSEELVAMEYPKVLKKNGFEVTVDDSQPPGRRLKLTRQPFVDHTLFDVNDLEEIISKLSENPNRIIRCSKAERVFASRACRKSIMIGDPLSLNQMRKIVAGLGTIKQPWNCPHGRPTMRHLIDLDALPGTF